MKRILVVDSDEQVASILSVKLKHSGFEAATTGDSSDALSIIPQFKPDIIVSEMIFPKMSGIDFMKRVKMNPGMMHIPFVFLSSSRDVENKILALDMGAAAVLAKPLFINDLLENIKRILGDYELKNSSVAEDDAPAGDISDISVLNILSIMLENQSSGEVEFSSSSDKKGVIFCDCGNVVRAETSDSENRDGMEELYKILSWSDGTFSVNYGDINVERNICIPQKKIIEKAAGWFREYSQILHSLPPVDTIVYLDFAKFVENLNRLPEDVDSIIRNIGDTGCKISGLIDSCGGCLRTASNLKQLFELDVISVKNMDTVYKISLPEWFLSCRKAGNKEAEIPEKNFEVVEIVENTEEIPVRESHAEENPPEIAVTEPHAEENPPENAGKPDAEIKKSAWDDFDREHVQSGKSGKPALFILLFAFAIVTAVIIFIYYRGLI
ncbi:response regulator [bacterium]|nr:response regulator [bacterium]